jgi:nucleotide-binding universal stress UspA family protein
MYAVLVPVDANDDRTTAQIDFLTSMPIVEDDLSVTVTHVLRDATGEVPTAMRRPDRVGTVNRAIEAFEKEGYETHVRGASAPPADGILEMAEEIGADLIVMGGRKRRPSGKALFGSVTQSVVLDAEVPVVVTGQQIEE